MPEDLAQSELMVLQAVRLAGVADRDAILDRAFVAEDEVDRILSESAATDRVECFSFGDSAGWIITEAGSAHLATLLNREVADRQATAVLEATLQTFEPLNEQFVTEVSSWQLRSTSSTVAGFGSAGADEVDELFTLLTSIGTALRDVLTDLIRVVPRFGRYPVQYRAALERAGADGLRWVTGVGLMSCHVVWAELHQDLLSSVGRHRHVHAER